MIGKTRGHFSYSLFKCNWMSKRQRKILLNWNCAVCWNLEIKFGFIRQNNFTTERRTSHQLVALEENRKSIFHHIEQRLKKFTRKWENPLFCFDNSYLHKKKNFLYNSLSNCWKISNYLVNELKSANKKNLTPH